MAHKENGQIVETTTEARAGIAGVGVNIVLVVSTLSVIVLFAIIYFAFFAR